MYLPSGSSELNSIENCWSGIKRNLMRALAALPYDQLSRVEDRERLRPHVHRAIEKYVNDVDCKRVAEHGRVKMLRVMRGSML